MLILWMYLGRKRILFVYVNSGNIIPRMEVVVHELLGLRPRVLVDGVQHHFYSCHQVNNRMLQHVAKRHLDWKGVNVQVKILNVGQAQQH